MMPFDAEPIVSIGSSQREWAAELTRFVSDYGGARLRGTVLTLDDALEQEFEVLIVDDIASYLNPRFVDRLRKMQRSVVGVYDPEQGDEAKDRLMAMGVDVAVEADASPGRVSRGGPRCPIDDGTRGAGTRGIGAGTGRSGDARPTGQEHRGRRRRRRGHGGGAGSV